MGAHQTQSGVERRTPMNSRYNDVGRKQHAGTPGVEIVAGKKKSGGPRPPSLPRAAAEAVEQAHQLIQRRRYGDALGLLREVDRAFPNNFVVLQLMGEA